MLEDAEDDATAAAQPFSFPDGHTPSHLLGADLDKFYTRKPSAAGVELRRPWFVRGIWSRPGYRWVDQGIALLARDSGCWRTTRAISLFYIPN